MSDAPVLKRSLSLPLLVLYGLGTTIGAGIYALIGEVAGASGFYAPVAFFVASLLAGVTALSFAELSARFPKSAGEAVYVREGFRSDTLALVVGLAVVCGGLVSAATIVNGFVGYFQDLVPVPRGLAIIAFVAVLAAVAAWGIGQSVTIAALLTLVELVGLLAVIWGGRESLGAFPARWEEFLPPFEGVAWAGILAGAFLAFYAFIGFEDMVNVAEEVKDTTHAIPTAIVITFAVTILLYLCLAVVAVLALPLEELAASPAPLALLFERTTAGSGAAIAVIAVLATINGALIQVIMAARILYGLASQDLLPAWLGRVNAATRTPVNATLLAAGIVLALALPLGLTALARTTSAITLAVFAMVNLALWRIKGSQAQPEGVWAVPRALPLIGFLVTAGFLATEGLRLLTH
jgi:amino acid transporter